MRRRRQPPDNRLDWRDPNMPCLTKIEYTHPFLPPKTVLEAVEPERMSEFSKQSMLSPMPNWRHDPTYDLAKRRRR